MASTDDTRGLLTLGVSTVVGGLLLYRAYSASAAIRAKQHAATKARRLAQEKEFGSGSGNRPRLASLTMERRKVTVQVPATTANMGSGYDCLGMALDMWNELTVERSSKFEIIAEGEGADDLPLDETNLVVVGLKSAFGAAGKPVPPLKYHMINKIPHGRGLGSSSAAIVAGILAGLALTGHRLEVQGKEGVLQLATEIEGHPDNVAPAMYGGIQLGLYSEEEKRWATERLSLPHGLIFVMFIPTFVGKTSELRKVVPKKGIYGRCGV
mmetsp:Transcript_28474/g.34789  ORF Transcript_28474/g.34789 Transcript_28474/m.34789 type:complete len:268 (+) Transcript_28474:254-1057(+)